VNSVGRARVLEAKRFVNGTIPQTLKVIARPWQQDIEIASACAKDPRGIHVGREEGRRGTAGELPEM
jgi:hypothetical protein